MKVNMIDKKLIEYFEKNLLINFDKLDLNQNLYDSGFIDSFAFIEMIKFLEIEFSIEINENDLSGNNFSTFNKIKDYLKNHIHEK